MKVYVGSIGPEIQIAVDGSEIRATLLNNTVSWDKLTLTLQEVIEGKADRTEIPTKVSELENDSEFVTAKEIDPELRKTSFEVVAHSDCTLEERVAQSESLLVRMLSGDVLIPELQVKKLGVWDGNNIVVTGEGAPSKAPTGPDSSTSTPRTMRSTTLWEITPFRTGKTTKNESLCLR